MFLSTSDVSVLVLSSLVSIADLRTSLLGLTVFQVGCLNARLKYQPSPPPSPTTPTSNEITLLSQASDSTVGDDDYISPFERAYFYNGVADDPPPLFQRSDLMQRPFPIPEERPAERHSATPVKTAHTANHPILRNGLWTESVAPEIIALCKEASRGIRVSTMLPVRFSTLNEDGKDVFDDHIVLWISVHPNTTKETSCRDANAPILDIFAKYNIRDVAVHWIEGAMESLAGPPEMMPVPRDTNPTHWIRRALTAVLGVPLAAQDTADTNSQGSLGLFFHRGKDRHGKKSKEVMAITNKHVVSKKTSEDYEFIGRQGARKKYIRNCGHRRFERLLHETSALLAEKLADATQFAEQLAELLADRPEVEDASYDLDLKNKEQDLQRAESDVGILDDFIKLLKSTWSDSLDRTIAWLDWAPKIANNVHPRRYTRDIGVMTLEKDKFIKNFKGNFVYLGGSLFFILSSSNENINVQLASSPAPRSLPASTPTPPTSPYSSTRRITSSGSWVASTPQASQSRTSSTRTTTLASPWPRRGRRLTLPLVANPSSRRTPVGISRASHGRWQSLTSGAESMAISRLKVTLAQLSSTRRAS